MDSISARMVEGSYSIYLTLDLTLSSDLCNGRITQKGVTMFAVIYRGRICHGAEETYQKLWHKIAKYFMEYRGAYGSCLHKTPDGDWIAYSRWPDKATRDASWPQDGDELSQTLHPEIKAAILALKDCIDTNYSFQEIGMEVMDDLLLKKEAPHA